MRDTAADAYRVETGSMWRPRRGSHTSQTGKLVDAEGGEARLYCYSEARAKKEQGIANRFAARFEGEMSKLHDGLKRPRTRKKLDHVWQRIGRISS